MRRSIYPILSILVVALAYTYVATGGFRSTNWPEHHMNGYYDRLATAFLAGHTYVAELPQNEHAVWDMSMYHGKCYLYFGPVPALLLYAPVRLLSGGALQLTDCFAALLLCLGTFLLSAALLAKIRDRLFPGCSEGVFAGCLLTAGLLNGASGLLHYPRIYEVAIAGGVFFVFLAIRSLFKLFERPSRRELLLLSGSLTLAVGCRPTMVLAAAVVFGFSIFLFRHKPWFRPTSLLTLALPFALGLTALGLYNHSRFDSFTEFGLRYQYQYFDWSRLPFFSFDRLLPGLYLYLIQGPIFTSSFPFLALTRTPLLSGVPMPYIQEYPIGLPFLTPISVLALWAGAHRLTKGARTAHSELARAAGGVFVSCGLVLLLYLVSYPAVSFRYRFDFVPFFAVLGALAWMYLDRAFVRSPRVRRAVFAFSGLSLVMGGYIAFFVVTRTTF